MPRHLERRRGRPRRAPFVFLVGGTALLLTACSPADIPPGSAPTATTASSTTAPPAAASPAAADPTPSPTRTTPDGIVADGTATENLPLFAEVTAAVWATPQQVSGRAYIDALVAAGFDKAAMQLTHDHSTVGNPAESIQFSVRWGQECLIGQVGPATGAPVAVVVPVLVEGTCLVGETRPIDW